MQSPGINVHWWKNIIRQALQTEKINLWNHKKLTAVLIA